MPDLAGFGLAVLSIGDSLSPFGAGPGSFQLVTTHGLDVFRVFQALSFALAKVLDKWTVNPCYPRKP